MTKDTSLTVWFSEVGKNDIPLVGGKGANLGEMTKTGFPVPNGFIVTAYAYEQYIKDNDLNTKIKHLLSSANFDKPESLSQIATHIKKIVMQGTISDELVKEIFIHYKTLGGTFKDALVAVRSSATAEDLPDASFAGQQETYLNVQGEANLIVKIKQAWASLFEPRAIFYRHEHKYDHFKVFIAIPVQKMVNSEQSGVMFTVDPITNDKSKIIVEAIYGLGEMIVQGAVTPDHYEVEKKDLKILSKNPATQTKLLTKVGKANKEVMLSVQKGSKQKISDHQIKALAQLGKKLEKHYYFPQDVEWAIEKDKIYLVQTRPITTLSEKKHEEIDLSHLGPILLQGDPASPGIASGSVRILKSAKEIGRIQPGDILVAPQTNPDFVPAMKKAKAIVTDQGGRTSHAAIVSRELGIPAVVGTQKATQVLKENDIVTVNGAKGEIYKGSIGQTGSVQQGMSVTPRIHTATKVYVNLAQPDLAETIAKKNVDGIGLLRAEFIMANIGTHPKKLIHDGKKQQFINMLAERIEMFCKPFAPRPVVYRFTDFKTNEYRDLIGGKTYEPLEANPMMGYRGAFRYMHDPAVFELELEAVKKVRNKMGYKNLWVMVPFVRTVPELQMVKKLINKAGLERSSNFRIWMMVEIPSNVILLDKFIEVGIDGVSIGSNDLTMLVLGTDRDNSEVASEYNEQDPAVLWAIERTIKIAHKYKITSSICGQAPSQYPELVEKLISWGITSVSVSPDAAENSRHIISQVEKRLIR